MVGLYELDEKEKINKKKKNLLNNERLDVTPEGGRNPLTYCSVLIPRRNYDPVLFPSFSLLSFSDAESLES